MHRAGAEVGQAVIRRGARQETFAVLVIVKGFWDVAKHWRMETPEFECLIEVEAHLAGLRTFVQRHFSCFRLEADTSAGVRDCMP
eukprot:3316881-Amphidinium_carterae.2